MGHEYQDRVSMELAQRIASELPHRPEWLRLARENLERWSTLNHDAPGLLLVYAEWQAILERPVLEICRVLLATTDEGQRLRQSSPFVGALTPAEVWAIKDRIRNDQNAA
jgi:hypothetical protein